MVNKKELSEADIRNMYISLSIKKIKELFAICDQLKENIIKSEDIKVKLGDCVVGGDLNNLNI